VSVLVAVIKVVVPAILTGIIVSLLGAPLWAAVGFGIVVGEIRGATA
jgi:hypothetical protein